MKRVVQAPMQNVQQRLVEKYTNRYVQMKLREFEALCDPKYKVRFVAQHAGAEVRERAPRRAQEPRRGAAGARDGRSASRELPWSGRMRWDDYFERAFQQLPRGAPNAQPGVSLNRAERFRAQRGRDAAPGPGQYRANHEYLAPRRAASVNCSERFAVETCD